MTGQVDPHISEDAERSAPTNLRGFEEWRRVPGHPNYWVSSQGRLLSVTLRSRILTPQRATPYGHLKVMIRGCVSTLANGGCSHWVHRLVLEAFFGEAPGMVCRHLDGNPLNNAVQNLEWGTHIDNMEDMRLHGRVYRGGSRRRGLQPIGA